MNRTEVKMARQNLIFIQIYRISSKMVSQFCLCYLRADMTKAVSAIRMFFLTLQRTKQKKQGQCF
jgi:hypothetical protein